MDWLKTRRGGQHAGTKARRDSGPCVDHFLGRFFDVLVNTSPGREDEIHEVQQAVQDTRPGEGYTFGAWLLTQDEGQGLLSVILLCARQLGPGIVKQACKRCLPAESCVDIFEELDKPDPSHTPTISPDLEQDVATAVTQGDLRGLRTLINDRGLNPSTLPFHVHSKSKDSMLGLAAAHGRVNLIRYMMESALQGDIQAAQRREVFSAISVAACRGRLNPVILLRQYWTGPAPDHSLANSPLHLSCLSGCEDLVRHLVEAKEGGEVEDPSYAEPPRFGGGKWSHASRVLGSVLTEGGMGSLRSEGTSASEGSKQYSLVERRSLFPVLQVESTGGRLPLHLACSGGHVSIVKLLLAKGGRDREEAQLNAPDHRGVTPLMEACKAATSVSLLEFLLAQPGLCVNAVSRRGYTALRYCVQAGWGVGTQLLLDAGRADPEVADQEGITPLQAAVAEGHAGLVSLLRQHGAALSPSAFVGAYENAAGREDLGVLDALLAHEGSNGQGGNGNSTNGSGDFEKSGSGNNRAEALELVLRCGCQHGSREVVEWARKKGAKMEAEGEGEGEGEGLTPLATAAKAGHINVVRYLVEQANVDVRSMDRFGKQAYDYASEGQRADVAKYLMQQSAAQAGRAGRKSKPSSANDSESVATGGSLSLGSGSTGRKRSIAAPLRPLAGHSDSSSSLKAPSSSSSSSVGPSSEVLGPRPRSLSDIGFPRSLSDSFWRAPSIRGRGGGNPALSEEGPTSTAEGKEGGGGGGGGGKGGATSSAPARQGNGPMPTALPSPPQPHPQADLPLQPQPQPQLQLEVPLPPLQADLLLEQEASSLPSVSTLSCPSLPTPPTSSTAPFSLKNEILESSGRPQEPPTWEDISAACRAPLASPPLPTTTTTTTTNMTSKEKDAKPTETNDAAGPSSVDSAQPSNGPPTLTRGAALVSFVSPGPSADSRGEEEQETEEGKAAVGGALSSSRLGGEVEAEAGESKATPGGKEKEKGRESPIGESLIVIGEGGARGGKAAGGSAEPQAEGDGGGGNGPDLQKNTETKKGGAQDTGPTGNRNGSGRGEEEQKGGADERSKFKPASAPRLSASAPPPPAVTVGDAPLPTRKVVQPPPPQQAVNVNGLLGLDVRELLCPLSSVLMSDPVVASDGYSYQRTPLTTMMDAARRRGRTPMSPVTGEALSPHLVPNTTLRAMVQQLTSSRTASEVQAMLCDVAPSPSQSTRNLEKEEEGEVRGGKGSGREGRSSPQKGIKGTPISNLTSSPPQKEKGKGGGILTSNSPQKIGKGNKGGPRLMKRETESTVSMDTVSTGTGYDTSLRRVGGRDEKAAPAQMLRGGQGAAVQAGGREVRGDKENCLVM